MPIERAAEDELLLATLRAVAPGTSLRDGLERILRGRTGALIVLGSDRVVEGMCSGGFLLDVEFSATRLRELAKMDGAIVLDHGARRILRAAVQLLPDPSITTSESGTRHRTAERAAKQTGLPVISVSQSMRTVALYVGHRRFVLENSDAILSRANQALATLERYKARLEEVCATLSALEIEDLVTAREVCTVVQRAEMVSRISGEISGYVAELGIDGRLLSLQLEELVAGVGHERDYVIRDYVEARRADDIEAVLADLGELSASELIELPRIAAVLGIGTRAGEDMDAPLTARGFRLLARVPRLPREVLERLVSHFGSLQAVLSAGVEDLQAVPGVGASRARAIREGLARLAESSILERLV